MKAIHNTPIQIMLLYTAVNYTQRYKKWKQFTTIFATSSEYPMLWTIHKDTKNESNSQHNTLDCAVKVGCELYTKIQKMKAIHNTSSRTLYSEEAVNYTQRYKKWKQFTTKRCSRWLPLWLWTIHKDTKNESNSQLWFKSCPMSLAVNYTQRYKKWKQFTTAHSDNHFGM